jgi:hypothetical protein
MPALRTVSREERLGARRWDAILLGSGVSSLVAAIRLGMAGHRVLVAEEGLAADAFPALREPFFLAGARDQGLLETVLKEVTMPLIERRRIDAERLALQMVGPELRMDVGEPGLTAQEMVAWGIAKPEIAQAITRSLVEASEAERQAMLSSPVVRVGRRLARPRPGTQGSHVRGLPAEAARPSDEVAMLLASQTRALSNLGSTPPSPEARARLLGSLMGGAAGFGAEPPWLHGMLRHRAESVHAEFRSLSGDFEIVDNDGEPGLMTGEGQLWLGRALVVAAPESALARVVDRAAWPSFLDSARPARRRVAVHLRCKIAALPEGMGRRVISLPPSDGEDLRDVTVSLYASDSDSNVEVVARALAPGDARDLGDADRTRLEDLLEERVRGLVPFAGRKLTRRPLTPPRWDDDDWLEDPPPGQGWPAEIELRVNTRPPVYRLDRAGIAGLGFEGDLLLGWRGGDAIAAELG